MRIKNRSESQNYRHLEMSKLILFLLGFLIPSSAAYQFYVTFHGGNTAGNINNVYQYGSDGTFLGSLIGNATNLLELRGTLPIPSNNSVLFCNANKDESSIQVVGELCGSNLVSSTWTTSSLISHPYDMDIDSQGNIYCSDQDSNNIVIIKTNQGHPSSSAQFVSVTQPRGVRWASDGNLYVAASEDGFVYGYSSSGQMIAKIPVTHPIGLFAWSNYLFMGSDDSDGYVYQYDVNAKQVVQTFTHKHMKHPAGIVVDSNGNLFVLCQKDQVLLQFAVSSGSFVNVVVSSFPDVPEQIALVNC
eukprot:TRINITY_DN6587_c0_g2_i1.p1 TRINITY_DN6587_c0_g2~~TRINITY_DN6587_c0_g2_i1.p1  ORF type:complete len:302 (-),score=59.85 TRINITY_DN6587_c0_g2_i1:48-953(-)